MYRSRLKLDLLDPSVQRGLQNANEMHRDLMSAFGDLPDGSPRASVSLLYSLMEYNSRPVLYVISSSKPDWSGVKGVVPFEEPRDVSALKDGFTKDSVFSFRLFASPVKKVQREGKNSAKVFLRDPAERRGWLERKAASSGFSILSVSEVSQTKVRGSKKGSQIYYTGVLFSGTLRITDADRFWNAYCKGIGPGKAYGLGMLMIGRL